MAKIDTSREIKNTIMEDKGIMLFDGQKVRSVWNEEDEKWYFSIVDVCAVLTDSDYQTSRKYWNKLGMLVNQSKTT